MVDSPAGSIMDVEEVVNDVDMDPDGPTKLLQKDNWRFEFLPYYDELLEEANNDFQYVKTSLAQAILKRSIRPDFTHALRDLTEFMTLYGKRFSKRDHINMVKLLYEVLILKGLDFRVVRSVANALNGLLSRKMLITREDIRVDWRPLYNLYKEIAYKGLEEEGLILFPEGLKDKVETTITLLSDFFEDSATQEILDLVRPDFAPFDDVFNQAIVSATLFLPTTLTHEQHSQFGASLWFEELFHWYSSGELTVENEDRLLSLFTQLSNDCPGFITWDTKIDYVLDRLLQSCDLSVGGHTLGNDVTNVNLTATLVAYNLGGAENKFQKKLTALLQTLEDFLHPSNTGTHLSFLLGFLSKLVGGLINRVSRERYYQCKHYVHIPQEMCLTDEQIDEFVSSLLPCLSYAAFAKSKQDVARIFRHCAFLAPGIILPTILDLVYPALENITEPHRLLQSLNIFNNILLPLARDEPAPMRKRLAMKLNDMADKTHSLRIHFITILNNMLPGLDVNDVNKSALTFQIIATIFCLMPIVDCSEAVHMRDDLTDGEKELCSATAGFEGLIDQLLQKCFMVIENYGSACNPNNPKQFSIDHSIHKSNEELLSERGLYVIIKQLTRNCSTPIFRRAMHSFFDFVKSIGVMDSRTAIDSIVRTAVLFITVDPKYCFPIFFNYAWDNLQKLVTEESQHEEELGSGTLWYFCLTCELLNRIRGDVIIELKDLIFPRLDFLLKFRCKDAYMRAAYALEHLILMLTSVYSNMEEHFLAVNDQPLDQYLPIRQWAKTVKKSEWSMKWHVPSQAEVDLTKQLMAKYLFPALDRLRQPESLDEKEMLRYTAIVLRMVSSLSPLMPLFDGERVYAHDYYRSRPKLTCCSMPKDIERLTAPDGRNLRSVIFYQIQVLTEYLLKHRQNDVKNLAHIIVILQCLMFFEGLDPAQYFMRAQQFAARKKLLNDPIRGVMATVEHALEDCLSYIHQRRQISHLLNDITTVHVDALKLLVKLGTSLYAIVRAQAQNLLEVFIANAPYSYRLIRDQLMDIISGQREVTHEEFKGALYILIIGKRRAIVLKQDWETLAKVWPTMVRAQHSDRPSIISLFDLIIHTVAQSFESFQISYEIPDSIMKTAIELIEDYDTNIHKSLISVPTAEELVLARQYEDAVNQKNIADYQSLIGGLYNICIDSSLHWRHIDMAQSLLSLLFRRDANMPDEVIKLFVRLLVHDSIRTRKSALTIITSWQKIKKVRSVKKLYPVHVSVPNTKPGAKWPIPYGLRPDNVQLIHDMKQIPQTPEEYNSRSYFTKWHTGFYTWPTEFKALAPLNEQVAANREPQELSSLEQGILSIISENGFMEKLIGYLSIEEKKGADSFVDMNNQLFYRFFRNLGPIVFEVMQPYLGRLLVSRKEGEQRLAAEIVSGLLLAAKLWKYERVALIVEWLKPRLTKCLETMTDEAESNWCTAIASVFCRVDIRQCFWLYDVINDLVLRSHGSGFHTTFRLRVLHSSIVQYEWRVPHLLHDLFRVSSRLISRNSQFLRGRVGAALASCVLHDIYGMTVDPTVDRALHPLKVSDMIGVINREIRDIIWPQVLSGGLEQLQSIWGTETINDIPWLPKEGGSPDVPSTEQRLTDESEMLDDMTEEMDEHPSASPAPVGHKHKHGSSHRASRASTKRSSTPPVSHPVGKPEIGRKREKAIVITLANSVYSGWSLASPSTMFAAFELLPLFAHFANDKIDDELRNTCEELVISEMGCTAVFTELAEHILKVIRLTVIKSCMWKTRITAIRFLQVNIFCNIYVYRNKFTEQVHEILDLLLTDTQIEVRNNAALTLSGFIQCGLFNVNNVFLTKYKEWSEAKDPIRRHAGVLALSAVVTAAPYKVPSYVPDILMTICKHVHEPQPIYATCKRTLNEFKRTHLDCWTDHKSQFNEDQLAILTNLLVSPNYYV